ncbi:MAG: hypothetical protein JOZ03_05370 [Gammaproteobacteria bacterium]|nr:hypothetical protein [Gammaproteobacteria bacterium]
MPWGLLGLALWASLESAAAGGPAEEQRLRDLDRQWAPAIAGKGPAKTASFYAEDASVLPFNAPIVTGRAKIKETWASLMARPGFSLHFEPSRIVVAKSRDVAFDIGTFELTTNDEHGAPSKVTGKYLVA